MLLILLEMGSFIVLRSFCITLHQCQRQVSDPGAGLDSVIAPGHVSDADTCRHVGLNPGLLVETQT